MPEPVTVTDEPLWIEDNNTNQPSHRYTRFVLNGTHIAYEYVYAYMGDTTIRLSDDAKERLRLAKREGESYDDVIMRLTARDKWAGFGALADGNRETRSGLAKMREELREGMNDDIEETGQ